jgi:pyrroline-5-carboxylate reductase
MNMVRVGIIGGGNMGAAILAGIRGSYVVGVCEQDSARRRFLKRKFHVAAKDLESVVAPSDVVILAVKPQQFDEVLGEVRDHLTKDELVISIAAGITCRYIEQRLGAGARVIRTMPNLPAQISEGMTALCKGKKATEQDLRLARRIFERIGKTVVVQERWMDAVTAVSGSGPAYLFLAVESMQKAAVSLGLTKDLSEQLIAQTLKGSLALLQRSNEDAGALRARVTSKGGTTQAAMDVFLKNKFGEIFKQALQAAAKRAGELSK